MKKPNIKRLKYPLWFHIVFYCLTVLLPLIFVMVEGYKPSNSEEFRWTFGIISGLVILWMFVYRFLIQGREKEIRDRKVKLEHEYEVEVGNADNIKWLWFTNEQKLAIFNTIHVVLFGALLIVLAVGIKVGALTLEYLAITISICYIVAYVVKFIVISVLKGVDKDFVDDTEVKDDSKGI